MATGTTFGGRCFASDAEAVDAYYSAVPPNVVSGVTSYMVQFVKDAGIWKTQSFSRTGINPWVLESMQIAPVPMFASCDGSDQQFADGLGVGWAIVGVVVIAWGFNRMKEQMK